ncbi:Sec-independent protein translocase subunit TatA/TatB [Akkermansia massiliensis]
MNTLAIFGLGTPEIIAILVIVFLLFGAKKLPEFARGLGKSLGEFKMAKSVFDDELLKTEMLSLSDAPFSIPESRPSPELSQPIDVEAEKPVETKEESK